MTRRAIIFVAIQMEAEAIASALGLAFAKDRLSATGQVRDLSVELSVVGIRGVRLPESLDASDLAVVISAGLAGGLDPALKCGDVVIDSENDPTRITSSDSPVTTPAKKAQLFASTGAAAVDMETEAIRRVASGASIPCVAIRAISDSATDAIDPAVLTFVDSIGRPQIRRIAWTLLRRPRLVCPLLRLRNNSNLALENLANSVRKFLASYEPPTAFRRMTSE